MEGCVHHSLQVDCHALIAAAPICLVETAVFVQYAVTPALPWWHYYYSTVAPNYRGLS